MLILIGLTACGSGTGNAGNTGRGDATVALTAFRFGAGERQGLDSFRLITHHEVTVREMPAADIIAQAGNGQLVGTDVVLLPNVESIQQLRQAGLLQTFDVKAFPGSRLNSRYVDDEGYWAGLNYWALGLVHRTADTGAEAVRSYDQLTDPTLRGRLRLGNLHESGFIGLVAAMLVERGAEATEAWVKGVAANLSGPPAGTDHDLIMAVLNKEADYALLNGAALLRWKRSGNPEFFEQAQTLGLVYPVNAEGRSYLNATTVGVLANAPHPDVALQLLERLYSKSYQALLTDILYEYPVEVYTSPSDGLYDYELFQANLTPLDTWAAFVPVARQLVQQHIPAN